MNKILIYLTIILYFSFAQAGQREQIIQDFITGTSTQPAVLDEMYGADVQLINHYIYWEIKGSKTSINIEYLQEYFNYYFLRAQDALCESKMVSLPSRIQRLKSNIPQSFMESMHNRFENGALLYPNIKVDRDLKSELAIYEMCQFGLLSFFSIPFDPAGLGGLNRNFESEFALERIKETCIPITHQVLAEEFNRKLELLNIPEDMQTQRLCLN